MNNMKDHLKKFSSDSDWNIVTVDSMIEFLITLIEDGKIPPEVATKDEVEKMERTELIKLLKGYNPSDVANFSDSSYLDFNVNQAVKYLVRKNPQFKWIKKELPKDANWNDLQNLMNLYGYGHEVKDALNSLKLNFSSKQFSYDHIYPDEVSYNKQDESVVASAKEIFKYIFENSRITPKIDEKEHRRLLGETYGKLEKDLSWFDISSVWLKEPKIALENLINVIRRRRENMNFSQDSLFERLKEMKERLNFNMDKEAEFSINSEGKEISITELNIIHTKIREINQTFKRKAVRFFINGKPISGFLSNYAKGFKDIKIAEPKGFISIILNDGDQYITIPYDNAKYLKYDLNSEKYPYLKVDFGNAQFEFEWSK